MYPALASMPTGDHRCQGELTGDGQTLVRRLPPARYAAGHAPPNRKQVVVEGPSSSAQASPSSVRQLTSTTAPRYLAPGGPLGVGVVSFSIALRSMSIIYTYLSTSINGLTAWASAMRKGLRPIYEGMKKVFGLPAKSLTEGPLEC